MKEAPVMESYPSMAGDFLRLNLGGRGTHLEGFKTVDLEPGSDIEADVSDLSEIPNESVSEIYASHILEHFSHLKTVEVLKEWRRVLRKGAKAYISVPDFDAMIKLYLIEGMNDFIRNMLYGDQIYGRAYHYTAFTFPTLAYACSMAGFSDIRRLMTMPYNVKDCSKNIDNLTRRQISVHVEAIA